ncbi:MAG: DUF433 domain-containing protein [Isosphaeraceae bacterium]
MPQAASKIDAGISSEFAIHQGEPTLSGTSTPVRAVVELWNQGMPAEVIPLHLPHLSLARIFEALHYYLGHRAEVDGYLAANRIPEELSGKAFNPATGHVE